ncbi:branched-chain amino acid ABC transporter permease [Terrarubrum flagellatum]|uniref:branched-chain amino acid ABC transporter permease n=1 Tax=Terrirubrum flagellatum TaxID=2895980 RepID=UPI0031450567
MALLLQAILNGLMTGALLAVPAVGFSAMFAVLRYPNFAIASYATIGAFAAWVINTKFGAGVALSIALAFIVAAIVGAICEWLAMTPLRPAGALPAAIASIALGVVLENVVRFIFGNDLKAYDLPIVRDIRFGDIRIGPQQAENALIGIGVMLAAFAFLKFTRLGRAMRAVADNADLARLKGIVPAQVELVAVLIGCGLCGVGGVLIGLDTSIDPLTGFRVLLAVFAAAVLGGLGSLPGAVVGAFALGIAEELSLFIVAPTYRSAIGFLVILVMLSVKPRGLMGDRFA